MKRSGISDISAKERIVINKPQTFGTANYYFQYGMGKGVAYYYAKNSILYCNSDRHGTSDQWTFKNLRRTY